MESGSIEVNGHVSVFLVLALIILFSFSSTYMTGQVMNQMSFFFIAGCLHNRVIMSLLSCRSC